MTNEEAKMQIQAIPEKIWDQLSEPDREAMEMAFSALEKQIPKRAVGEHYAHMRCPSCNHRIPSGAGSSSRRRDNWCNYCGQAIDWGKNNYDRD